MYSSILFNLFNFSLTRELIVVMELVTAATYDCVVSDDLLKEKVRKLDAELSLLRPASHHDSGGCDRALLTSTEVGGALVDYKERPEYIGCQGEY